MNDFMEPLRAGTWLTRERARLVALVLLVATMASAGFLAASSNGFNDIYGRPLGTDFANVYAAGTHVLDGNAGAAFDPSQQYAREQMIFGTDTQFYGWHYPPFFLGVAGVLALIPYPSALAVWLAATLLLYVFAIRAILLPPVPPSKGRRRPQSAHRKAEDEAVEHAAPAPPALTPPVKKSAKSDPLWLLLALAFPAVFINIGHGNNGFLTAALFGGALVMLDKRPAIAGVLIGLLAYKPQFAMLIPVVLVASGRWRAFFAAALTVAGLALAVSLAFGFEVWSAFIGSTAFTRHVVLEQGGTGWHKIQSVFSWVRLWGGTIPLAYAVQGAVTLGVAGALAWLWRSHARFPVKAGALLLGTLLATPYVLDYDLMLLAPAIAFLAADGMKRGFAPWEKTILALLWLMPLVARSVTQATHIPLAVPVMVLALLLVVQRARAARSQPVRSRGLGQSVA